MTIMGGLCDMGRGKQGQFVATFGSPKAKFRAIFWSQQALYAIILALLCAQLQLSSGDTEAESTDTEFDLPTYDKQMSNPCQYPCKKRPRPQCKAGVSTKKDGCGCYYICTRQQGDLCDARDICDEDKGLYCFFKLEGGPKGICRAKAAKPCNVNGTNYKDGQEFNLTCRQRCTCQNGQYACTTLCPQEDRAPSTVHCKDPMLVQIRKRCCREWVCPNSHSLPGPDDHFLATKKPPPTECKKETSEWSSCSHTCGMGVSLRLTNDNRNCENMEERRLCFVRPCDMTDKHLTGQACKSTWKDTKSRKFINGECESVLVYRPKYCSTCKKRKCCGPGKTKTRRIEFQCPDGKHFTEHFMWIKSCECFKTRRCPFR